MSAIIIRPERPGDEPGIHALTETALLGDPGYYARFGFEHDPQLFYPGPPAEYFQRLVLDGPPPAGVVRYASAFSAA